MSAKGKKIICPILPNQEFVELPSEDELLSFIKELGYSGKCYMLFAIHTDQMHQPRRTFAAIINRDTPGVSVSKKKAPPKADRGKGIELLSGAALLKDAQLKKVLEKIRQETYKLQASRSSKGADFESKVPDESKAKPSDTSKGTVEDESDDVNNDDNDDDNANDNDSGNEDDDGNDARDSERTDSDDDDENPSFTLKDHDEEEHDEEYETDDDNENVYEEEDDDLCKDVDNVSQEKSYEQVIEDVHVTLTSSQKTESSKQCSSVSSDFDIKFLILDNVPPVIDEVASMINELSQLKQADHSTQLLESAKYQIPTIVDDLPSTRIGYATRTALHSYTKEFENKAQEERKLYIDVVEKLVKDIIKDEVKSQLPHILPKEVSDFPTLIPQSTINESLKNVILAKSSSQPKSTYDAAASLTEFELKKILLDKIEKSKSYQAAPKHKELYDVLRDHEGKDKDEDPPAGSNEELKKQKMRPAFNLLKDSCKSFVELEFHFEECYKVVVDRLDWNNPEGHEYPFDLSKPLPLIEVQDLLLFLFQKKLSNLEKDVIFDLNVTLWMFTRCVVILKRVEDHQLGVKSYQKKLNITNPKTFRSDISKMTPYTTYKNQKESPI
nr:hypothetical protein [Tanacetum cinerariifolium]